MTVKVRFAPSPTGKLHVGNMRTALITWLFCRHYHGHYLLRIDDTDPERSKEEYVNSIKHDLTWLGLHWDSIARQSERTDRYQAVVAELKKNGRLYPCYETADELALKRKTLISMSKPPIYDRGALSLTQQKKEQYKAEGRKPHWRFKLNHTPIEWNDLVRGPVHFNGEALSDPVVMREDGSLLYHLCSVIDDHDFDITHIIRGEDHVSNTATHIQMFEAIGGKIPQCAHLAMLSGKDGDKLSKRLGSLSVEEIREVEGIENMAINSLLAKLGTSDPIEAFPDLDDLAQHFDFSKFSRASAKFDTGELERLNARILHEMDYKTAQKRLLESGLPSVDEKFWLAVRPNLARLKDITFWWNIVTDQITPVQDDLDFTKHAATLLPPEPWDENTWDKWISILKEETGRKGKELFMPLRKALTGMEHGPELKYLLPLMGSERCLRRLGHQKVA